VHNNSLQNVKCEQQSTATVGDTSKQSQDGINIVQLNSTANYLPSGLFILIMGNTAYHNIGGNKMTAQTVPAPHGRHTALSYSLFEIRLGY